MTRRVSLWAILPFLLACSSSPHDATLKTAPCGTVHWPASRLPLFLRLEAGNPGWVSAYRLAVARWPVSAVADFGEADPTDPANLLSAGVVTVAIAPTGTLRLTTDGQLHGDTTLAWAEGDCLLRRASILIPEEAPLELRERAVAHEIGHALGFGWGQQHSTRTDDVMFRVILPGPFYVAASELALVSR